MFDCTQKTREYYFCMTFFNLQIHSIVTPWMIALLVSWACVYSWEPMGDSGFGLHWGLTTMILLVPFGPEIEMCNTDCLHIQTWLRVHWFLPAALCHHGGCRWPGTRWTSVHQQLPYWLHRCGSCFAMERLTAACVCTNLMLLHSLSMNLHLVIIRHINIFRPSSEMFKTFKTHNFVANL